MTGQPRHDRLFELVPPIYRLLDENESRPEQPGPLRGLLAVLGEQTTLIEDDLRRWYENWFIETCEDWVVPYLGDLVGYEAVAKELYRGDDPNAAINRAVVYPRREIAETLAFRRRKGTLAVLEELSRRIVGWPARAVEYRHLVAGTASIRRSPVHPAGGRNRTVDFRRPPLELGTAFETHPRLLDVRRMTSKFSPGRHNLAAVGLFVCRRPIDSATLVLTRPKAWPYVERKEWRTFDVQGLDVPLFILPTPETSATTIAERVNLPLPLTRRILRDSKGIGASTDYYGFDKSVVVVTRYGEDSRIVPAEDVLVADLRAGKPPKGKWLVAIDPESGRLAFPTDRPPDHVWTTSHYGRPAPMGGGEYDRTINDVPALITLQPGVDLGHAIDEWEELPDRPPHSVIEIADNDEHIAHFQANVPPNETLEIRAANRQRPYLSVPNREGANIEEAQFYGGKGSRLILDGLLIVGGQLLIAGEFDEVILRDCTLTPGRVRLVLQANDTLVRIERSIVGLIETRAPIPAGAGNPEQAYNEPVRLSFVDSIFDGNDAKDCDDERPGWPLLSGPDGPAHIRLSARRTTVLGAVEVQEVDHIENSVFAAPLSVANISVGCLRFSYLAPGSRTPPQFHCQPAKAQASEMGDEALARVVPSFVSTVYKHPDYARLADDCCPEILRGADDEGEMGVYHSQIFAQRAKHLRARVQEFIPVGSDAELVFLT